MLWSVQIPKRHLSSKKDDVTRRKTCLYITIGKIFVKSLNFFIAVYDFKLFFLTLSFLEFSYFYDLIGYVCFLLVQLIGNKNRRQC